MGRVGLGWIAGAAVGLALLVVILVVTSSGPQRSGVNGIAIAGAVTRLDPGETLCQRQETVPAGTTSVRVYTGTPHPPVALRATVSRSSAPSDRVLARGSVVASADGFVAVPLQRLTATLPDARVCLTNRGTGWLELGGAVGGADAAVTVAGRPQGGRLRIDYYRGAPVAQAAQVGQVAERFGLAKAGLFGTWTLWLALALVVGSLAVAAAAMHSVLRADR